MLNVSRAANPNSLTTLLTPTMMELKFLFTSSLLVQTFKVMRIKEVITKDEMS